MQPAGRGLVAAVLQSSGLADGHYLEKSKRKTVDAEFILARCRGPLYLQFHHSLL